MRKRNVLLEMTVLSSRGGHTENEVLHDIVLVVIRHSGAWWGQDFY